MDPDSPTSEKRRRRGKKNSEASEALKKIRRSRETGVREETALATAESLFEYVNDDEYARLVQQRQEDDWICDDDGSYRESGREIFDEEADTPKEDKKSMMKSSVKHKNVSRPTGNIKSLLMMSSSSQKKKKSREDDSGDSSQSDPLLGSLLEQLEKGDNKITKRQSAKFTPRSSDAHPQPQTKSYPRKLLNRSKTPPTCATPPVPPPASPLCTEAKESVSEEDVDELVWRDVAISEEPQDVKKESTTQVPQAAVSSSGWETVKESMDPEPEIQSAEYVTVDASSLPTVEIDGQTMLPFFWLDAYEDPYKQPGTVYLFGKVYIETIRLHVRTLSGCLYLLPRDKFYKDGRETETTMEDVYKEFNDNFALKFKSFTSKRVTKKYAFELVDVPHESEYLQVLYSAEYPAPPPGYSGQTFSHVFGGSVTSLERLVINCHLKGPGWLHIKNPKCSPHTLSWSKLEVVVSSLAAIQVLKDQPPPPPLTIMSLAMKTVFNTKTHSNEVVCLGAVVHPAVGLDKPSPKRHFTSHFCGIRRLADMEFPFGFEEALKIEKLYDEHISVEVTSNERALLAYFLAKVHKIDADIIVGHNISSFDLEVLQHRMNVTRVPQWSRIGRLKRSEPPKGRAFAHTLCCGRPVCDIKISAKELIRAQSYDLTELASTLKRTHVKMDNEDICQAFSTSDALCGVIKHTLEEAELSLSIAYELCALPLAYQITCIAGNVLSRTLMGGRAERNEYLLLHAFNAKDYICPDKHYGKKGGNNTIIQEADDEEVVTGAGKSSRRKPAYAGGLVLEPKRGFYDRFVVLLDFNSLYPSIIQEFNICFTTIDHAGCSPDLEDLSSIQLPDPSEPPGVLPSEIRVLVERRRSVKQLMKGVQPTSEAYMQYDIRQKALKLTANSMYGCLGFANSRFYAKPLAALVTSKGREILALTRDTVQKMNYDVIYGDTDSIMIDTKTRDMTEAESIGQKVKAEVNTMYRLLEIEVDGIFKCMLLLKKKKYAAVVVESRNGHQGSKVEVKGLDIVRRDWCTLAKDCGYYVLNQILSGDEVDTVVSKVQHYLEEVKNSVDSDLITMDKYVITKSLTKPPADYPDKKGLPHVQVALRMLSRNQRVQSGDVIPYIMCEVDTSQPNALRAFHPDEVSKQEGLKVDKSYYLQHQVHAVVSRLCDPIPGLDPSQIALWLGLDPSHYRWKGGEAGEEDALEAVVVDTQEKFKNCKPLTVLCPHCNKPVEFKEQTCRLVCTHCSKPLSSARVRNTLSLQARSFINKHYLGWMMCDDVSCQFRTRNTFVVLDDSTPSCPGCLKGRLKDEYPASALYTQLQFFQHVFSLLGPKEDVVSDLVSHYCSSSDYSQVNLQTLFPKLTT
eukprot:Em0021g979a